MGETDLPNRGRRRFIVATAAAGGGLAVGLSGVAWAAQAGANGAAESARELSPWLVIRPDGQITVRVTLPEVGTGLQTQMAMYVAEELPCDWQRISTEMASLHRDATENLVYSKAVSQYRFFAGRSTTPEWMKHMLQLGASTRERLRLAAAQTWGVPLGEVSVQPGRLVHAASARQLGYGEVAERAVGVTLEQEPALKPQAQWTLLGKASPPKKHIPQIVTGQAQYGIDVRLPGMLYATLLQCPVMGGRLVKHDPSEALKMPGVKAVLVLDPDAPRPQQQLRNPDMDWDTTVQAAVVVVAEHYWQARQALAAVKVQWADGAGAQWKSEAAIVKSASALVEQPGKTVTQVGAPDQALPQQARVVEATYHTPYCEHAMMEPLNGTALVTPDRVDVWHPAGMADVGQYVAALESGLPIEKVHFNPTLVGGHFGRRNFCDDVRTVVAVARQMPGVPVHVIWSREETFRQGRYRALNVVKLKAGLDKDGLPQALIARTAGRSFRPRIVPEAQLGFLSTGFGLFFSSYASGAIPNSRVEYHDMPLHVMTGPFRGPGYNSNAFILEGFIDECAHAAGMDPLAYRLKIHERWPDPGPTLCLKEVATKAGWGRKLKPGMAQGIAVANWGSFGKPAEGTTVAAVATVEVSKKGVLKVHAIDLAYDCGRVLNRDAVHAQLEGAVVFGLNLALNEGLSIENGRIVEGNFDTYPMVKMADLPAIRIHDGGLSNHERFAEIGEPGVGVVAPAIVNAIFRATGKRVRATPLRKQDLRWA